IRGSGMALPPLAFTNEDICQWHGRRDATWVYETFGVRTRHTRYDYHHDRLDDLDEDDLVHEAAQRALKDAGMHISDVQVILLVTFTPTTVCTPDPACILHQRLGAPANVLALTHVAGCAGTLNVMMMATAMIRSGQARNVLVCSASSMSSYNRPELKDRIWLQASIFGDGAAALVLSAERTKEPCGFASFHMHTEPGRDVVQKKFGGSKNVPTRENFQEVLEDHFVIDYRAVPNNISQAFSRLYNEVLAAREMKESDWVLFNMSNAQLQRRWLRSVGVPEEKEFFNMEHQGNCAAASLGLVLHDFLHSGRHKSGQTALILGVGSGLHSGGVLYRFP
ncbi:MAG TPA: 3-oxoacyl-[acyl-carrier-protein] synthase III C-terminal domain-containing protein, partial [Archangium sp.]|nr:3-oxoacyl-[acyl-carrier-protein] synthase III C-terminal domain-containing protein [Archangium sp.]